MTPDRWQRTEAIFHAARARSAAGRAAFLASACGDDDAMRREVESLLIDAASDDGFLAQPAAVLAADLRSDVPPIMTGRTLGGYRLQRLLGAGGMGEVYRAHDTRLGRDVAIKILPAAFTDNPDRLARFEREARMLAALNHPNICTIYGVEEAAGVRFLILEFVAGDTLAVTIANRAPMPLADVLAISCQIADALEAAHDRGIVHRDLKPANVSITAEGVVKVLDFGLAKAVEIDGSSSGVSHLQRLTGRNGAGAVIGTAAYMSPEQARGLDVDGRTDVWAFGCVLYEMLTGRAVFGGDTVSDSIARVLEREPDWSALPPSTPIAVRRLLQRCLAKDARRRLRDIGDAKLDIEEVTHPGSTDVLHAEKRTRKGRRWLLSLGAIALIAGVMTFLTTLRPTFADSPFANAQFSALTDWDGTEALAEISPDGRFVVFLSDRAGQLDIWWTQVGTDEFKNLTEDIAPLDSPGVLRTFGFSGDGAEVWFGAIGRPNMLLPQTGGRPRPFLAEDAKALAWSPDGSRIAYFTLSGGGDPLQIADRAGSDGRRVEITPVDTREWSGVANSRAHNHNPVWSPDQRWIYFVHGVVRDWNHSSDEMDIWRVSATGGSPERLTHLDAAITFLATLDNRTLLYVAPAHDGSGSWLWSFDVDSRATHRVISGLEQFTSVSISRDGRRVVATRANPVATLWTVPIVDTASGDEDVRLYPLDRKGAQAPRFGGTSLFYLSARGTADGLWRSVNGQSTEVQRGTDGILLQGPAPSPDGLRVAIIRKRDNTHLLTIMAADGTNAHTLAPTLDAVGAAEWSPDGKWVATGAIDGKGQQGLFKVAVDGDRAGDLVQIASGEAINPVWSPDGAAVVYAGPFARGQATLSAVGPDGTPIDFAPVRVSPGGYRFLPDGTGLVYLPRPESLDFWLLDFASQKSRQLTHLGNHGTIRRFDLTRDGKHIVFDRVRQNSDTVLIDLPRK
jgi:serine/threonine protein kinase/Tol biopolymer transport system component